MKSTKLCVLLLALGFTLNSCSIDTIRVNADDAITYKKVNIKEYDAIEIANGFNAYVTFSDTEESIEVEANANLHKYIIATKKGNKLIVKVKNNINIRGQETLNVYIKTKSICNFSIAADSNIYLQNTLVTETAKIRIAADSYFSGKVEVSDLELTAAADARADLYGHANYLYADLSADAKLSDYELEVQDLKIRMSADCNARLTVTNTIDINAIADCTLRYKGDAAIVYKNLKADSKIIKVD